MTDYTLVASVVIGIAVIGGAVFYISRKKSKPVLDKENFQAFKLVDRKQLTGLTEPVQFPVFRFRFALPRPTDSLGLPIGQHISLSTVDPSNGKEVLRSYTPTSSNDDKGHFDLVVKIYPQGIMGQHLVKLNLGDSIQVRGPKGRYTYIPGVDSALGMLAGGSGITPMFQIMTEIAKHHSTDKTKVSLLYGNVTKDDIILRNELDELVRVDPQQFNVYHVLNNPPEGWEQGSGFITIEHMKQYLPAPSPTTRILLCGPPPMLKAMQPLLEQLGHAKDRIFTF
eukprot:TRINITY_DN81243_c0_g1_i1.p1 TRINITY_DN81243_c0_g1~~TRINITY_DN81243_c0_g1_i1.p1  ORF type:complete len:291 (-),score=66.29 TRINITY_DN81243_c0_g1_i1:58-903(-)